MSKNYLTQVVWLSILTVVILLIFSIIPPIEINHTTKQVDLLSSIRTERGEEFNTEQQTKPLIPPKSTTTTEENSSVDSNSPSSRNETEILPEVENRHKDVPRKLGDITLIEDYTPDEKGLQHFARAINRRNKSKRPVRIAFLGDSFIEADILTQNIREALQEIYGGCGVGYMAMHSDFPGFRRSITQIDKGWNTHNVSDKYESQYTSLPLQFHRPTGDGKTYTRFKGVNKLKYIDCWEVSTVGFIADNDATITLKTDSSTYSYDITADSKAQFITLQEPTSQLEIHCDNTGVAMWGAWLDAQQGIAVDNISIRGYSGTTIQDLPLELLEQLNDKMPYDLIVLQYGLNRMTASITNYDPYTTQLNKAIAHLQEAFPQTDILIMGIGDRCKNENGEMKTMKAIYAMTEAQRNAAMQSGCLFWDTYEAMKSLGGMPYFVNNKWANKDYTHINHAGGRPLSNEFVKALTHAIK